MGACLVVVAYAARRSDRRWLSAAGTAGCETGLVLGLFALWQYVRVLAITEVDGGIRHAQWIWDAERMVHLPSELTVQQAFLGHPWILQAANQFYAFVHFPAMNIFLIWLFARHRDRYSPVRNTVVFLTAACLLVQMIPVAPPRMLTDLGFVDTALYYGQSVYGAFGSGIAAQLSAMPSVHVGWAVLIAYEVVRISPSRWRWLIVAHPILTIFVVTVTANHFWADGIVAVGLLVLADLAARGLGVVTAAVRMGREPETSSSWAGEGQAVSGRDPGAAR